MHVFHVAKYHHGAVHQLFIVAEFSGLILLGDTLLAKEITQLLGAVEQFIGFAPEPFIEFRYGAGGGGYPFMNSRDHG